MTNLSWSHLRFLYMDTDSIYLSSCQNSLDDCVGLTISDCNHYKHTDSAIQEKRQNWMEFKRKFFVPPNPTQAEKRRPGLWKQEYATNEWQGEAILLSP